MQAEKLLRSAKTLLNQVAAVADAGISVKLWDGSVIPLGPNADPDVFVSIASPGVIGSLLRKPGLENVVRHFARGTIDFHGADFMTFIEKARVKNSRKRAGKISKLSIARNLWPFLFAPADKIAGDHEFQGNDLGHGRMQADNQDYIQFHYDISNDFYRLFLDDNMVYSCGYFHDWNESVDQAQINKLDMVCRKLQLQPGESMLDIGSGWGALICHAAQNYGVHAHGITLSQTQLDYTRARIKTLGLEDRVTVELKDFSAVEGCFDKISSVGMAEHVGIANIPMYLQKVRSLLPDRGIFLNHAITRTAKKSKRRFGKVRPERRLITKYIFPGGELDHIGHTLEAMESNGFRVQDVEGWRDHYALTCKRWCQRLWENREEAAKIVGPEKFRLWLAYLGCISFPFNDGSLCLFQTVATKHAAKGHSSMPPTRSHLYETHEQARRAA